MKDISISEDIVPLGQFKSQASRLLKRLASEQHPLVITQNGRPAAVMLSPGQYDRLRDKERFLESVAAGIADADAGRVIETAELRSQLALRRGRTEGG